MAEKKSVKTKGFTDEEKAAMREYARSGEPRRAPEEKGKKKRIGELVKSAVK